MKIFLSHTFSDKPVVEPVALKLAEIFGQKNIFYDSWSIKPGDGIIDKMNEGLENADFGFFFISKKSLQSEMVKLEWQNMLYKATQHKVKLIPVRLDSSMVPAILLQNVYIDMHLHGIDATVSQMLAAIHDNSAFVPQHANFKNVTFYLEGNPSTELKIVIRVSHLIETNLNFIVLSPNTEDEMYLRVDGGMTTGSYIENFATSAGRKLNGFIAMPMGGGAITPIMPFLLIAKAKSEKPIEFIGLYHKTGSGYEEVQFKAL